MNEGINLVYCDEQGGEKYYLRLTHAKLRSKDELQATMAYQIHLFENGAPVCEPVKSQDDLLSNIYRHQTFKGISEHGKTSIGWFLGFKAH